MKASISAADNIAAFALADLGDVIAETAQRPAASSLATIRVIRHQGAVFYDAERAVERSGEGDAGDVAGGIG